MRAFGQMCHVRTSFAIFILVTLALVSGGPVWSQSSTSTVLGTVVDAQGGAVSGASIALINEGTGNQRSATTDGAGNFLFPSVLPGVYTAKVESPGFQTYRKQGNVLSASERLSLGVIQLSVGSVTETVSVTAEAAVVQTASSESSAVLTTQQLATVAQRGRNVTGFLRLLPGVNTSNDAESLHGGGGIGTGLPNVGGVRGGALTVGVDGQQGQDNGSSNSYTTSVSLDAVAEVKVLLNNYQAEYGRNGGAVVNVVSKSGTRDFHGSAYWYKRHEMFNAQNFFNNAGNLAKPRYRYITTGATVGGPVMIPKVFNTDRQKLFFFVSVERNPSLEPQSLNRLTMPTALERMGNFSESRDQNGNLFRIKDPLNPGAFFANNIIPQNRINSSGQALLNLFSLPNALDPAVTQRAYNFEFQDTRKVTRDQQLYRVDYKASDKDQLFFRATNFKTTSNGYNLTSWDYVRIDQTFLNKHAALGYTRVLSPSMVNELNLGVRRPQERIPLPSDPEDALRVKRSTVGFTAGQLYPVNPDDIIPRASFGGISNAPNFGDFFAQRFPQFEDDINWSVANNLTYLRGKHTFKFGVYGERDRVATGYGFTANWMGEFQFNTDSNNPLDSGNPYSNAILGNFRQYTEASNPTKPAATAVNIDWFVQDSWKVTQRLTLELGLRSAYFTPWDQTDGQQSYFALGRYNPANAPVLYQPGLQGTTRVAVNPLTGETLNVAYIGAFVPGTGDPSNGTVTTRDGNYPEGFYEKSGQLPQPRFGFALDVFGNGRTAVRGGFAKTNQLVRFEPRSALAPISFNPTIFNGNLDTFRNASGVLSPGNVISHDRYLKAPDYYNLSLGVQQNIGFGTVLDVKYVSTLGRNLSQTRNINQLPYGIRFLPSSQDPSRPAGTPLTDQFLRPMPGYNNIDYRESSGSSNYHALQVSANRRYANGLQAGVAYTYSKTMDYTGLPVYRDYRQWSYGKADFDQTHVMVINYTYDIPGLSKLVSNVVTRAVLDNWQVSGITTFASGTPLGVSLTTTNGLDLTGGGDGQRANITGDPRIPHSERGITGMFDTSVVALPQRGDAGNAPKDVFRGPGLINSDVTLFKNFPLRSEQRALQLRWEVYNIFNHTNFTSVDNTARFDPATGGQVNARFGQPTAARNPRLMQVSLRFSF